MKNIVLTLNLMIMKTNNFVNNSVKAMASFFLAGLLVLTIWCFKNVGSYQEICYTHGAECPTPLTCKIRGMMFDTDMKRMQSLNERIASLEKKKSSLNDQLEKAKLERNLDCGMAVGIYSCPSHDLSEITYFEGKMAKIDRRITAMKKSQRNIAQKYGLDIQQMAFVK